MNEKEKREDRFKLKAEELEITLRPQCLGCKYSQGLNACGKFGEKPKIYRENKAECPGFSKRK